MNSSAPKCWICGNDATTGEHMTKRSDLRAEFGSVSQAEPLYFHDNKHRNRPIGSFKADVLKFSKSLCAYCNNTRTQPHDRAWENFSAAIRVRQPKITPGSVVRANRIFPYDTASEMLNVHLYYVKILGCHIVEKQIPIDIKSLASAIQQGKAHPNIYLKFGIPDSFAGEPLRGASNALAALDRSNGQVQFFTWIHSPGNIAVNVMYAVEGEKRDGLIGAWHPRLGTNKLAIYDFRDRIPNPTAAQSQSP
jgi:hypothetical protein